VIAFCHCHPVLYLAHN